MEAGKDLVGVHQPLLNHQRAFHLTCCLMRDVESRATLFFHEDGVTDVSRSCSDLATESIRLLNVTVIMRVSLSCHFSALFDLITDTAGFVKFVHAVVVFVLGDGFDAIRVVEREFNFRLHHVRSVNAAIDDTKRPKMEVVRVGAQLAFCNSIILSNEVVHDFEVTLLASIESQKLVAQP